MPGMAHGKDEPVDNASGERRPWLLAVVGNRAGFDPRGPGHVFWVFGLMLLGIVVGLDAIFRFVRGVVRPTPPKSFVRPRFDAETGRPILGYDTQTGEPILGERPE